MMYDGPILDNHFHMNPQGLHVEAAKIFQKVGGTHLVLVHCPDFSQPPTTRKGHVDAYQKTIEMAQCRVLSTINTRSRCVQESRRL